MSVLHECGILNFVEYLHNCCSEQPRVVVLTQSAVTHVILANAHSKWTLASD